MPVAMGKTGASEGDEVRSRWARSPSKPRANPVTHQPFHLRSGPSYFDSGFFLQTNRRLAFGLELVF
jgi:hypothetical protein